MAYKTSWNTSVHWNYQRYRQIAAYECVNQSGSWRCPQCKCEDNPTIIAEALQFGFNRDMYTEFVQCVKCHRRIAIISQVEKS